jgi:hypothetical protein
MSIVGVPQPGIWSRYEREELRRTPSISADARVSNEWRDRKNELLAFRKYRENWDGFDAAAPDPELIDVAIRLLHRLKEHSFDNPPDRVAIAPDGMVAIEWQFGESFLRAEIESANQVTWMLASPGHATEFWDQDPEATPGPQRGNIESRETVWQPNEQSVAGGVVFASVR